MFIVRFLLEQVDNVLVFGDFNMTEKDSDMLPLIDGHKLFSMIKEPTCFKSDKGRCIDLLLTNRKHNFIHSQTFETGISDHHCMIYTMFKTKFIKIPPKTHIYRCYKNYSEGSFLKDLILNLNTTIPSDYDSFVNTFISILDKHVPIKKKILRGNNKPYVNKALRKAIST